LNEINNISNEFIIYGDFNIDYIKDSSRKNSLDSILASFNLFATVKFPTRIFKDTSTQIDNIYANIHKFDFSEYPVINDLSDHDAQIITVTDISISTPKQTFSLTRKIDSNTIKNFVYLLSCENWKNVFMEEDVNIIYNNFINTYIRIFYTSFPLVKIKNSQNLKPWLTKGIKISFLNKRRLYLKYRNSNNPTFKTHYKRYCQILSKVITTAKRLHYNKLISQFDNKHKTTWDIIKTITNNTKTPHTNIPIHININETPSTNPMDIANAFNAYFTSVTDNLLIKNSSKIEIVNNNDPMTYL